MKVAINGCFGGYGLSARAIVEIAKRKGIKLYMYTRDCEGAGLYFEDYKRIDYFDSQLSVTYTTVDNGESVSRNDIHDTYDDWMMDIDNITGEWSRTDPDVIAVIEELGDEASDDYSAVYVVEIPDDVKFTIDSYDGRETIEEVHRSWA